MASSDTYMSLNTFQGTGPNFRYYAVYEDLIVGGQQGYIVPAGSTLFIPVPYSASGFGNVPVIVKNNDGDNGPIILSWHYNGESAVSAATMQLFQGQFAVIPTVGVASGMSAFAYGASAALTISIYSG